MPSDPNCPLTPIALKLAFVHDHTSANGPSVVPLSNLSSSRFALQLPNYTIKSIPCSSNANASPDSSESDPNFSFATPDFWNLDWYGDWGQVRLASGGLDGDVKPRVNFNS